MAAAADFYAAVSGERLAEQGAPLRTAWRIERLASQRGWPAGELLGSEDELREQLGVGREALRESISILCNRGVVEVRRGRKGGIQLLPSDMQRTAHAVSAYLRLVGTSHAELSRCLAALDRLLAYRLARGSARLPSPRRSEPVRHWLARACGDPLYLLYYEVLDALVATERGDQTAPAGLHRAIRRADPEEIVQLLGTLPAVRLRIHDGASATSGGVRAFAIAEAILARSAGRTDAGIRNEIALCEEFSASRAVIRQSLRILQDLDVVHARRGRSGGYEVRRPRPIGVIRQIYAWLEAGRCCPYALVELMWDLNTVNARSAAARLGSLPDNERARQCAALDEILGEEDDAQRFVHLQQRLARIAGTPLVDIVARSIACYQALHESTPASAGAALSFRQQERALVAAARAGDQAECEASIRAMQRKVERAFQR